MKRIIAVVCIAAVMLTAFAGCKGVNENNAENTKKSSVSEMNVDTLADAIFENVLFDDIMTKSTPAAAKSVYGLADDYTGNCAIYVSTGATPEEIAVFEADEAYSAEELCAAADERIAQQSNSYSSYAPDEVPKLENAVVYNDGLYVVVCVSADNDNALRFIKGYLSLDTIDSIEDLM